MRKFLLKSIIALIFILAIVQPNFQQAKYKLDSQLQLLGIHNVQELAHPDRIFQHMIDNYFNSLSY